jgi:hypothetical protein
MDMLKINPQRIKKYYQHEDIQYAA